MIWSTMGDYFLENYQSIMIWTMAIGPLFGMDKY
jgi:hypothetical protein